MTTDRETLYRLAAEQSWAEADPRAKYSARQGRPRIVPDAHQAGHCRRFNQGLLILDEFLPRPLWQQLTQSSLEMAQADRGWSRPYRVNGAGLQPHPYQETRTAMDDAQRLRLEQAMDAAAAQVHECLLTLTRPDCLCKYNAWINTGSVLSPEDDGDFHFWHYDSDEFMEFYLPQDLLRFPVWGAILYLQQPNGEAHYTVFDDQRINQKVRSIPNRLLIFDPSYMHRVSGPRNSDDTSQTRLVMVFNAWDYDAPDTATLPPRQIQEMIPRD